MKELLLYSPIWDFTAEAFIEKVNELPDSDDIKVRLNSPGGSVFAGWSIIGKMKERAGKMIIAVDGHAASMAFIFTAFADKSSALDVTRFMVHKASGYVKDEEDQKFLDGINLELLAKLKKKIDLEKFKELTGFSLDQVFKGEERKDVWLSSKEAKDIGLIDKVVRLDPSKVKAYTDRFVAFADFEDSEQGSSEEDQNGTQGSETKPEDSSNNNLKTNKKMTSKEFKSSDPDSYNDIIALGEKSGEATERDRVKSWLAFIDVDKDEVIKAIKDGTPFSQSVMAEMTVKLTSKKEVENIEGDGAGNVETESTEGKTKPQKEIEAAEAEVKKGINVKNLVQ